MSKSNKAPGFGSGKRTSSKGPVTDKSQMSTIAKIAGGAVDGRTKNKISVKGH